MDRQASLIIQHIKILSNFDRVMCSTGYEESLDYVIRHLSCPFEWIHLETFPQEVEYWNWKVPTSMNFWRDVERSPLIEIPSHRPMKVLDVRIPGKTEQEILIVAHLDHPKPSANDNASGAAMMIELINYFSENPPEISLRFLFTVEYFGTVAYCYQHEKELSNITAGISLDMVGANQNICSGTMIVDEIPHHHASCLDLIFWYRLKENARQGRYREIGNPVMVYHCDFQFYTGGSDHYILNDATIGIPATCLSTYPDPVYHTQNDTADKISPETIQIFFSTILSSLKDIGDQSSSGLNWCSQLIMHRFDEMANRILLEASERNGLSPEEAFFRLHHACALSASRLKNIWSASTSNDSSRWMDFLKDTCEIKRNRLSFLTGRVPQMPAFEKDRRFVRLFKAPLHRNRLFEMVTEEEREEILKELKRDPLFFHKIDAALNYCPSRGTSEISRLLLMHYGGEPFERQLNEFFEFLCRYSLMEARDRNG